MTMRWNRSRWVPTAWATAALIGSACDTHTIVAAGVRGAQPVERRHDAHLHLAEALAAGEAERRGGALDASATRAASSASLSARPVHSPKSHSIRPLSTVGLAARAAAAIGAAVSRARSSGDV